MPFLLAEDTLGKIWPNCTKQLPSRVEQAAKAFRLPAQSFIRNGGKSTLSKKAPANSMKTISWPRAIIAPIVSVAILAVILLRINGQDVWLYLTGCEMHWLLAALLVTLTFPLFSALRWRSIVSAMGCPIKLSSSLRVTMAVFPLNTFLPSSLQQMKKT